MVNNVNNSGVVPPEAQVKAPIKTQVKAQAEQKTDVKKVEPLEGKGEADVKTIENAVQELNKKVANQELNVSFSVDEKSGRMVVKIHDKISGELVRQVPSEETLRFAQNVDKGIGALVDSKF